MTDRYKNEDTPWRDCDVLEEFYVNEGMNTYEIADELGTTHVTVSKWLDECGLRSINSIDKDRLWRDEDAMRESVQVTPAIAFADHLRWLADELEEWVRNVPYARSVYEEWVHAFFNGHRPDDPIERAGRFWALRYMQFAGDMSMPNGFKVRAKRSPSRTFDNARERLQELADRFSDVTIENRDWSRILDTYDDTDVDVVFYCDPPYVDTEHYYSVEFDHTAFVDGLASVESDWMVSYAELPDGLAEIGHVVSRDRRHRMCREASDSVEHLVCSFDPTETPSFLGDGASQQTLEVVE